MRIGVLAPAEIAIRRFMPALTQASDMEFAGVAVPTVEERFGASTPDGPAVAAVMADERDRAAAFIHGYGGTLYEGFAALVADPSIDGVYVPLPPGLHATWGRRVVAEGKHLFMEKPFTVTAAETAELLGLARAAGVAAHENYMFAYHAQLAALADIVASGAIGEVRLIRLSFGFPRRAANDFRYDAALGGGALLDAGGYTLRYAAQLLGAGARVTAATSNRLPGVDVDMFGSATVVDDSGATVQLAFGMDNSYRCDLDVWGSTGSLTTGRVLTAPAGFVPSATVTTPAGTQTVNLPADDAFLRSIEQFQRCVTDPAAREARYSEVQAQADLVEDFKKLAGVFA